ncbi:hypothetical protein Tco_0715903 [Tanacetum coccineum]
MLTPSMSYPMHKNVCPFDFDDHWALRPVFTSTEVETTLPSRETACNSLSYVHRLSEFGNSQYLLGSLIFPTELDSPFSLLDVMYPPPDP